MYEVLRYWRMRPSANLSALSPYATSVCGFTLLLYEDFRYWRMRPSANLSALSAPLRIQHTLAISDWPYATCV